MGHVVAVAGPAGGGKSTLVQALAAALPGSPVVPIDRYQKITEQPIREIVRWMERGADFNEFSIPGLASDLQELKLGNHKYVLFETHFGRAHGDSGRFIDFMVWLDTPLDVALGRNVMDLVSPLLHSKDSIFVQERLGSIQRHLASYLQDLRRLRLFQRERVAKDADLVLDGTMSLDAMVEQVLRRLP